MPSTTTSHLTIPPKIFIKIDFTSLSESIIFIAYFTLSIFEPPPISKKFAGFPPKKLIKSIVAIANPAPLTKQPIFPSNLT